MNDTSRYVLVGIASGAAIYTAVLYVVNLVKTMIEDKRHEKKIADFENAKDTRQYNVAKIREPHPIANAEIVNGYIRTADGDYIDTNKIIGFTVRTDKSTCVSCIYALFEMATTISSGVLGVYHGRNDSWYDAERRAENDLKCFLARLEK